MVNADSWQSSVVELAQAGNLRAIAFWINRYLVPQGICAQVLSERPGHLVIRTVCHHAPDADRLMRFICQRLIGLNSEVIQSVRITAQLVGSSQLLWMKSARLSRPTPATPVAGSLPFPSPQAVASPPAASQAPVSAPRPVQKPQPTPASPRVKPIQFAENPRPGVAANPVRPAATQPQRVLRKKRPPQRPLIARWSRATVQQVAALPHTMRQLSTQSIDWFAGQTLPVRALTLGGSAVAVFFVGCGFEMMRQYVVDPAFRESTSAYTPKQTAGTVKAALERVPVIQADVADPDNPAVTLLFSNSAALGGVPKGSNNTMNAASLEGAEQELAGGIAAYRQADLVMTSLDNSLSLQQLLPSPGDDRQNGDLSQANLPIPEQEAAQRTRRNAQRDDRSSIAASDQEATDSSAKLPPVNIHELLANGIDIVNLANDASPQGDAESAELVQTIDVLHRSEIQALGAGGDSKEARRPQIFQVKGQRIAYLGYAESPPVTEEAENTEDSEEDIADSEATEDTETAEATENTEPTGSARDAGMTPELIQQVTEDIQAIRDQVDWIVVSFHWQQDLRAYPEEWQTGLAHLAIDQGADLVVGYHPNLTQGAEIYKGRAIAYSLGSSIAKYMDESGDDANADRDTVTLKVSLQDQQMQLEFLPVHIQQGEATLAEGEAASKILRHFEQASSFFDHPIQSKATLDSRVRVSLPTAPDAELPTEPFLSYPESPQEE